MTYTNTELARAHVWWPKGSRKRHHPHYRRHEQMLQRCYNPNSPSYHNYGGRGIRVCTRWIVDFDAYCNDLADLGPQPKGWTLDRINGDGDYEPGNVRWASSSTQNRNRRSKISLLTPEEKTQAHRAQQLISTLKRKWGEYWKDAGEFYSKNPGCRYYPPAPPVP